MDPIDYAFSCNAGKLRRFTGNDREFIRQLREKSTQAEVLLWKLIRNRRILGLNFRRQHKIGKFIADFFCIRIRLVIELDGSSHVGREERDKVRTEWMETIGIQVLRFPNIDLFENPENVLKQIERVARQRMEGNTPPP